MSTATGYSKKVIEALYENGDPVSIDAAELLEQLTENAEPEADKPVAWYHPSEDGYDSNFRDHEVVKSCTGNPWTGWIPLYTRPEPARKPMTEEEMRKGSGEWAHLHNIFEEGIRFAEKHHGIGGDDGQ